MTDFGDPSGLIQEPPPPIKLGPVKTQDQGGIKLGPVKIPKPGGGVFRPTGPVVPGGPIGHPRPSLPPATEGSTVGGTFIPEYVSQFPTEKPVDGPPPFLSPPQLTPPEMIELIKRLLEEQNTIPRPNPAMGPLDINPNRK